MNEINRKKMSLNKKNNNDKINEQIFVLNDNLEPLGINKIFIGTFLTGLWNYPEAMFKILKNSGGKEIKTNLAPLIVDNFYTNYISGNYMENNLLYIIALMLKDEIDKLMELSQVDTFLDNTRCGYLLEQLLKKADIQIFFKKVIIKTIEKIESLCSFREINFNVLKRGEEIKRMKESIDKGEKKGKKLENITDEAYKRMITNQIEDPSFNFSREESHITPKKDDGDAFVKKYVPNITLEVFEKRAKKAKDENNNNLSDYFNKFAQQIKEKSNKELFSNANLMSDLLSTAFPPLVLTYYQNDFMQVVSFIEQLIDDLIENILLLPNSVKCICKIISILIKNKFKNIKKTEENGFISKFFLGKLLIPIISLPSFNALISDFVISGNTLKNIETTNIILSKLFSGDLFYNDKKDGHYTAFNWIFLDKMEKILDFFDNTTNVNLPEFIEKFITNKLPKDYEYDFYEENKEEIYANISICFNIKDLILLIEGLKKSPAILEKSKVDKLKKAFNKLNDEDTISEIKNAEEKLISTYTKEQAKLNEKSKEKNKFKSKDLEVIYYFFYNDKSIEKKYQVLFDIDNKIANFYIDLKKLEKENGSPLPENEKSLIKVKNYLSNTMGNYRLLNISDYKKDSLSDTIKMLTEIKSYMALPNFTLSNDTIPSTWYINSLLDSLKKIPENYKKNDFQKLFDELDKNLKDSIEVLDFQKLIMFRNKLKFIDKINNYYENTHNLIIDISINEKIKELVEEKSMPIEITFRYIDDDDKENNKFELKTSNVKDKHFDNDKNYINDNKKNIIIFKTIESFASYFPNLAKYQLLQDISPLQIIKELKIAEKINHYFDIIRERFVKREGYFKEEEYDSLYQEKIKDYFMNKIYDKIYPPEPDEKDSQIYQKAMKLEWVEPQLIVEKEYIYDNILPDILNQFNQINNVKTPLKKLKCFREIFNLIHSLIRFNDESKTMIGSDDVTPVLNYAFIKAHPFRIYTDLEFVKLFLPTKEGIGGYDVNQLESAYTLLLSYNAEHFKLKSEEYEQKCKNAANSTILLKK